MLSFMHFGCAMCGACSSAGGRTNAHASGEKGQRSALARSCAPLLRMLAVLSVLALALLPHLHTRAHAQTVRVHLSADSVKVGERFLLSLVADHNFMTEVRFPPARADSGAVPGATYGDLVVLALRDSSRRYLGRDGLRRDSLVYEVTTFALDTAQVAPLPISFVQNGDTVRVLTTEEHLLPVVSVLPPGVRAGRDSTRLKPLTPPVAFPRPLWPWLLGVAGLLTLAALLAYLWRQRRQEPDEEAAPSKPPVPPAEAARRRLRRLEETTPLDAPDAAKPFYTDLAHTLRRYLMHRLGLRAFRSTTTELVEQLRRRTAPTGGALPEEVPERARRALEGADLAKFADQRPPAQARRAALADARAVIDAVEEALKPDEPPAGEENGKESPLTASPGQES